MTRVAGLDPPPALDVGRPRLHADDVVLVQDQFRRVLDGHDPLGRRDGLSHGPQQRALAGPGAAADEDVPPADDGGLEEGDHLGRDHAQTDQVGPAEPLPTEATDAERRPVDRDGRERGVDAAAVGQAGVDHRRPLIDPPAHAACDPLDDPRQVVGVAELDVALGQPAVPLDVDAVRPIDQHVGHGRVGHQRRQRSNAQRLLHQVVGQPLPLGLVQRQVAVAQGPADELADVRPEPVLARAEQTRPVDLVQHLLVQTALDGQVPGPAAGRGRR